MPTRDFRLSRDTSLSELEHVLSDCITWGMIPRVIVPNDMDNRFFVEARAVNIFQTLAKLDSSVEFQPYQGVWTTDAVPNTLSTTLVGTCLCFLFDHLRRSDGSVPSIEHVRDVFRGIWTRLGIVETTVEGAVVGPEGGLPLSGKSVSVTAFDPRMANPSFLSGPATKPAVFAEKILRIRQALEASSQRRLVSEQMVGPNAAIGNFAFELYRNTVEHGRTDEKGRTVAGVRFLQLKKYIGLKQDLLQRAAGFPELEQYIQIATPVRGSYRFYELSISDAGLGLVAAFYARTGGKKNYSSDIDDQTLIQRLVFTKLSSKPNDRGAGAGLPNALAAALSLGGFISIRTGKLWLYKSFDRESIAAGQGDTLQQVQGSFSPIIGTQISMLFPLPIERNNPEDAQEEVQEAGS